ncbi:MAG: TfoX/Sxy family protein [Luteimonas sp.]
MASTADIDHLLDLLAPIGPITARRMFGGWGVYVDGRMIGLVVGGALHLKTDAATQAAFEAAGSAPFVYATAAKTVATSYWSVPDEALDAPDVMLPWARLALAAALRKANNTSVRKRRTKPLK